MQADRELDALVAEKVMGYTLNYEFAEQMGAPTVPVLRDQYDEWGVLPAYSTDIAAAWAIVEKMQAQGAAVLLRYDMQYTDEWEAGFGVAADEFPSAHAPNASMAICLAALRAVGVDNAR